MTTEESQKIKQSYLPSKRFIIRGTIATSIVIIILITQTLWFKSLFVKKQPKITVSPNNETVGNIVSLDSNGNGIPDWEERLWGLDPTVTETNGVSNKDIIEAKIKALDADNSDSSDTPVNKTDAVARQLYVIATALGQTNQSDQTLQSAGSSVGQSVTPPIEGDHYSVDDIKTVPTTILSLKSYYKSLSKVLVNYQNDDANIDVIINALESGDFSQVGSLEKTATDYKTFASDLQKIPVPVGVASYHLAIMNSLYGISDSFDIMQSLTDDGIDGLAGLATYKKYYDVMQNAVFGLHQYLIEYGILTS